MRKPTQIHETILRDIVDVISDAQDVDLGNVFNGGLVYKSVASQTSNLILVFPIITSSNIDIKTAAMICKAQERQAVSMLQILFSAVNINSEGDIFTFLRKYHSNLSADKITVDGFISAMTGMISEGVISIKDDVDPEAINAVMEDLSNLDFYFEDDLNEHSMYEFSILPDTGEVIQEARPNPIRSSDYEYDVADPSSYWDIDPNNPGNVIFNKDEYSRDNSYNRNSNEKKKFEYNVANDNRDINYNYDSLDQQRELKDKELKSREKQGKKDRGARSRDNMLDRQQRADSDAQKYAIDRERLQQQQSSDYRQHLGKQLLDTDVKKANELQPTLMVVRINQVSGSSESPLLVPTDVVIGVKAKVYKIDSNEIINRLVTKSRDKNWLMKLIKASTREISFFRDLVFAIDKAKIDAKHSASKGSTAKIFKLLERRSSKSKFLRRLGLGNTAAAISTIHITKEEVDLIKKISNIDLSKARTIRPLMEAYNLMSFVYTDESEEVAYFIYDTGDDMYEVTTFGSLERESSDGMTKKIINLMTKMSR